MHREFFTKYEYFWEYEYPFGNDFLKNIFKDNYMRKYSLVGDGIFNLILFNDKIYDISIKKGNSMLLNDGKKAFRDADKDIIVEEITKALKNKNIDRLYGARFGISGIFDENFIEIKAKVKNDAEEWWRDVKKWWSEKVGKVEEFTTDVKNKRAKRKFINRPPITPKSR